MKVSIAAVGSNQDIQPYIGSSTKVIDLKGALATPGFIDGLAHFTGVGQAAMSLKRTVAQLALAVAGVVVTIQSYSAAPLPPGLAGPGSPAVAC